MAVDESRRNYTHPLFKTLDQVPGMSVATAILDDLLTWGQNGSLWIFPMATSCCAIEFITAAASRVDIDQMGAVVRPSPRHADVMIVAGTITVKMAPRVKKLWEQMPEPKWCIAMGSCAISGDFYRDIYSVVPGVDIIVPVDVYIPGCPPNPDQVMVGLKALQQRILDEKNGKAIPKSSRPATMISPDLPRYIDGERDETLTQAQHDASRNLGLGGNSYRENDAPLSREGIQPASPASEKS